MTPAEQIRAALDEIGVPGPGYPASIANAVWHLHNALGLLSDRVWLTRDEARELRDEVYSSGVRKLVDLLDERIGDK